VDAGRVDEAGGAKRQKIVFSLFKAVAISKGKLDAGQGGKLGHSNQNHWQYTEEIKEAARKWRRLQAKSAIAAGLTEFESEAAEHSKPDFNDEFPQ
jgi:hypothetical protein